MLKFAQLATSVKSRYRAADAVTVVAASEVLQTTIETGGENLPAEHNKGRRSGRRACACELRRRIFCRSGS